jgi:hypothetical protein
MNGKIKAAVIIEIAGRPAEHVSESLKAHVKTINDLKNVKLIKEKFSEPKEIENVPDAKGVYTCFADIEIEAENFLSLMDFVFDFMPSSIEIFEPYELNLELPEATMILNRLAGRMHRYDEIAKISSMKAEQAENRLKEIYKRAKELDEKGKKGQIPMKISFGEEKEEKKKD